MKSVKNKIWIHFIQVELQDKVLLLPSMEEPNWAIRNYILDWNWNLSAYDLFNVNYKLFPMVRFYVLELFLILLYI